MSFLSGRAFSTTSVMSQNSSGEEPAIHHKSLKTEEFLRKKLWYLYRCSEGAESFSLRWTSPVERRFVGNPVFRPSERFNLQGKFGAVKELIVKSHSLQDTTEPLWARVEFGVTSVAHTHGPTRCNPLLALGL